MPAQPILQIIPSLDAGGAERTTIDIARALVAAGYPALVASEGGRLESELRAVGGELIRLPVASKNPITMFDNAKKLAGVIKERRIRLVHARSRAPAWSGYVAARFRKIPFVTTFHGIYEGKGRLKRFYNSIMARGDAVIANSGWTAEHIRRTYPHAAARVAVIPRGLDMEYFDSAGIGPERVKALLDRWAIKPDERIVLLPGRLARWKGQLVFLRALGRMKRNGRLPPGVRVVIAGDAQGRNAYTQELLKSVAHYHLEDVVVIAEHIVDMAAAYLVSDIVVSASTEPEAFGRIAPEAAAMGRTVIATDHGGSRETVISGETGFLVKPDDASALGHALSELLSLSPEKLAEMGRKGHDYVKSRFTLEKMCTDTLKVYRDVMFRRDSRV